MKKAKLCKLALLSLSAFLVFGCEAKGDDQRVVTNQESTEYYKQLTPAEQERFDQMTEEEKAEAIQSNKRMNMDDPRIERSGLGEDHHTYTPQSTAPRSTVPMEHRAAPRSTYRSTEQSTTLERRATAPSATHKAPRSTEHATLDHKVAPRSTEHGTLERRVAPRTEHRTEHTETKTETRKGFLDRA